MGKVVFIAKFRGVTHHKNKFLLADWMYPALYLEKCPFGNTEHIF